MARKKPYVLLLFFLILLIFTQTASSKDIVHIEYFYSKTCPDCAKTTPIINEIEQQYADNISIERLEVSTLENWERWNNYGFVEVPAVVINNETKLPKERITKENLTTFIDMYLRGEKPTNISNQSWWIIDTPFGQMNLTAFSLPVLTLVLGSLDSINPCSFWVLLFLLSLLLYAQSRRRMLLIGGIFIFFSGFIYFLFMSVLLGIFILTTQQMIITIIAGVVALILGGLNIKDFFFFKKGLSLSISDEKKPELFKKMRTIVRASYLPSMILGTVMLAIFANTYELFCTMGFPLVYTKILTLYNLSALQYSLYLVFYNIVYVIPLLIIVVIFTITLGARKLTEWQGRILKLFSGLMMAILGFVLIFQPQLVTNVFFVILIPLIAVLVTSVAVVITKKYQQQSNDDVHTN